MDGKKKVILVDMDGVLADFERGMFMATQEKFQPSQIIQLADRKSFYVTQDYPIHLRPSIEQIYTAPGFFENLPVIPGGKESLEFMQSLGHEVFICTSSIYQYVNCVPEKYNWIAKHLGNEWTNKIIMTGDKTLVQGHILIDDKPDPHGVKDPSWEHIIYDAPYNRLSTDKRRITWETWKNVLPELFTSTMIKNDLTIN